MLHLHASKNILPSTNPLGQYVAEEYDVTYLKKGKTKNAQKNHFWFFLKKRALSLFLISGPLPPYQKSEKL